MTCSSCGRSNFLTAKGLAKHQAKCARSRGVAAGPAHSGSGGGGSGPAHSGIMNQPAAEHFVKQHPGATVYEVEGGMIWPPMYSTDKEAILRYAKKAGAGDEWFLNTWHSPSDKRKRRDRSRRR